jgi:adenylosuccinate synthase
MPCTIVVGGQYGSEGKGKVTALTAALHDEPWVVRCGGPNSGHTTNVKGREVVLRQIPAAAGHPNALLMLAAGCAVSEEVVLDEIERFELPRARVVIDPRAVLVAKADLDTEQAIAESIGSTASGTGAALVRRMMREAGVRLAGDSELLYEHARIEPVAPLLHDHLDRGGDVIIEGTQGFGLSLLHGPHFPYVTSRDTTASAFAMEVGLSPRQIDEIIMVIRTFPIRVGGNSGPLPDEISWEEIQRTSNAPEAYPELTSVTRRLRRVGRFDIELVKAACLYNRPTALAVMGADRLDYSVYGVRDAGTFSSEVLDFLANISHETGVPTRWVGTGFGTFEVAPVHTLKRARSCHA